MPTLLNAYYLEFLSRNTHLLPLLLCLGLCDCIYPVAAPYSPSHAPSKSQSSTLSLCQSATTERERERDQMGLKMGQMGLDSVTVVDID